MRKVIMIVLLVLAAVPSRGLNGYEELISKVSTSCANPVLLLTSSFTNDMINYRRTCTDVNGQCAADLALAISLMHRMDCDEACVADAESFRRHQILVSNIVYCSSLGTGSWIRYAAAAEYMAGLNYNNQYDSAYVLSTNMIAKIQTIPPDMGSTNYWNGMSSWMKCPNETLLTVFRSSAAVWLAEQNRKDELIPLTNSLPASALSILLEEQDLQ